MPRPPRLPDSDIQSLIAELRAKHAVLTGTILRDELRRRHGSPCGVSRIYRLLRTTSAIATKQTPPALPSADTGLPSDHPELRAELAAALERARLAEHREEHHQARWANEIHELREQVKALRHASQRLQSVELDLKDRSRELASAYYRIADLETQLRALQRD